MANGKWEIGNWKDATTKAKDNGCRVDEGFHEQFRDVHYKIITIIASNLSGFV